MPWHWIAVLALVSNMLVSGARGQTTGQGQPPAAADSAQSEISTRSADAAIKVQVNLVLVRVVVRDSAGRAVPGLKQEDFQVFDNGKRQKISSFNAETADSQAKTAANAVVETSEEPNGEATAAVVKTPALPHRFLALVFDDLHMKAADAMAVRAAATKLFASLTPTDRAAIYSTGGEVKQDFTDDAETLRKTLAAIVPHPVKGEGQYECPNITYYQADLIVNKHDQDAIIAAAVDAKVNGCTDILATAERILEQGDELTRESYQRLEDIVKHLSSMPGQRVLAYVSPGFILADEVMPNSSNLIERAIRAGVVVNTIDARGLYTADVMPDISAPPQVAPYKGDPTIDYQGMEGTFRMQAQFESGQVLAGMAASTGGRFFHNRNDLDVAMSQALEAPAVSYVLGFAPQNPVADGKFHSLKAKLANGKRYQIEARNGYYALKKPSDPEEAAQQEVREALFSQDEIAGVPAGLRTEVTQADATSAQLTVLTHLDVSGVHFRKAEGRNRNDFVFATGLFDRNGQLVDGQMKEVELKLMDSTLEKMRQDGLTFKTVFTVKPGTYTVRGVVRGSEGDPLTALNLTTVVGGMQPKRSAKNVSFQNIKWAPPNVDAPLKSFSTNATCDLSEILTRMAASALALASNLERFTAQEHIDYVMLDHVGMVEDYDSGSFQYVYSIEQQNGGSVSREYRTPAKGGHMFRAAGLQIGGATIALMFLPDLQTDYEMKCEGANERNGQLDWVVHFQQRKDRPDRTAKFWVGNVSRSGMFKGRAWISKENFQVVHLEASLVGGVPDIGLEGLAVSVDYRLVQSVSGNLGLWLPDSMATYWDYNAHRLVLTHSFSDFQLFTVETREKTQEPRKP